MPIHHTNFTYLADRLREAGFGEELNETLRNILDKQPVNFELPYKVCFSQQVLDVTIYVKRWKQVDQASTHLYYVHKYHAALSRPGTVDKVERDFYFGHQNPNVTVQQAYNLLSGRAVYRVGLTGKDNPSYNAWVQLDFSQTDSKGNFKWQYYGDHYGYDLEAELLKYPILGLSDPDLLGQLITALQNGYRELVTIVAGGKEVSYFIDALPKFKSLNIYDDAGSPISRETRMRLLGHEAPAVHASTCEGRIRKRNPIRRVC